MPGERCVLIVGAHVSYGIRKQGRTLECLLERS